MLDGAWAVWGSWRLGVAFPLRGIMVHLGHAFPLSATSAQPAEVHLHPALRKIVADVPADHETQEACVAALAKRDHAVALAGNLPVLDNRKTTDPGCNS